VTDPSPSQPTAAAPASKSLAARLLGVLFAPRATYAVIAARPRWLGALAFVVIVGAAGTFTFLSTEIGQQAMMDQQVRMMESFGVKLNDAAYDRMEASLNTARYTGALGQAITVPVMGLIIAGIMLGVFNAALGGDGTFKQVYSIIAHSAVVLTVSQLFGLPLAYARETMSGATNLAVFTPFLDENSFAARALGSIDLFILWWIVSFSIGLGVLYKKRTGPIATSLIVVYVAIGLIIAAIKSAVGA
jgi:Yip1-like protein